MLRKSHPFLFLQRPNTPCSDPNFLQQFQVEYGSSHVQSPLKQSEPKKRSRPHGAVRRLTGIRLVPFARSIASLEGVLSKAPSANPSLRFHEVLTATHLQALNTFPLPPLRQPAQLRGPLPYQPPQALPGHELMIPKLKSRHHRLTNQ